MRAAPPTSSAGTVGTQNWVQLDSVMAMALRSSQGNRAATVWSGVGWPQPAPMSLTAGPCVPHAAGLQFLLDEYRRYANTERAHQGLAGRTPAEVSTGIPQAEVLDLATVRSHRPVRREYAHGLLSGYTLVPGDDDYRQAA